MASQARFEAVQTQIIESEHTSLRSTNGTEHKIGVEPRALSQWQAGKIIGALMDVLAIALSCTFFVYALAVKMHENMPMESPQAKLLTRLSNLGPTIYPILFAAVIGRALKSITFWKLERGGRIGTLDRLLGSMTIVQTVLTQVQTGSLSVLGLLLIAIWSLSPLGGQASLRIIDSAIRSSNTTWMLQYVDTHSNPLDTKVTGVDTTSQFVPVDVLFGAAMLGSLSNPLFSVDNWGNMKVPRIESLDSSTADAQGWYPVPQLNSSDDFASLIGIPLSMVSHGSNITTSFNIETSYWTLSCPVFEDLYVALNLTEYSIWNHYDSTVAELTAAMDQFEQPGLMAAYNTTCGSANVYLFSIDLHNASLPWDSPVNTRPRHITYMDDNNDHGHWVAANCTIRTTYVEVSAACSSGSCTATDIRSSRKTHAPETYTPFDDYDNTYSYDWKDSAFYWFSLHFAQALSSGSSDTATPYQNFIIDPQNPFNGSIETPITTVVSNATFALRLSQLLNTYWMAILAPNAIPKGLRNTNLAADAGDADTSLLNTTATETRDMLVLKCNVMWFVILMLSSIVTVFIGLCGLIAALCRLGPDIGFNISSLVKGSPFVDQTSVATTLGSTDRSILMKDWYAKIGDVAAEDEVGYIAIGSGNVANLQRGRLYR